MEQARFVDVGELARLLGVKPSWVYGKVASKEIPHVHVGRYVRFIVADVVAWLGGDRGAAS